ncbi:hypothetical protein [Ornithinimicrobium cavernae]|uniref:hypothetical protein n=1 Tax=Ornithinimicrobium cavernae TaxID=2666047 RepID=UPI000D69831C|nr:hypothetical protein [Ornithinimicrobium cavernae]
MGKQPKKERLLLAILGGLLVLGGFAISAFMLVVSVVLTVQGERVEWPWMAGGIVVFAVIGLVGVWVVRRSGVPLGDAINF